MVESCYSVEKASDVDRFGRLHELFSPAVFLLHLRLREELVTLGVRDMCDDWTIAEHGFAVEFLHDAHVLRKTELLELANDVLIRFPFRDFDCWSGPAPAERAGEGLLGASVFGEFGLTRFRKGKQRHEERVTVLLQGVDQLVRISVQLVDFLLGVALDPVDLTLLLADRDDVGCGFSDGGRDSGERLLDALDHISSFRDEETV